MATYPIDYPATHLLLALLGHEASRSKLDALAFYVAAPPTQGRPTPPPLWRARRHARTGASKPAVLAGTVSARH